MTEKNPLIYTNSIDCSFSEFEFRFGFNVESQTEEGREKYCVADIHMSPQLARAFLDLLQKSIAQYDERTSTNK